MTPSLEDRALQELDGCSPEEEEQAQAYLARITGAEAFAPPPAEPLPLEKFSTALRDLLTPWTDDEFAAAREPYPHVFQDRHVGIFPVGEVSIVAAAGREGKTTVKIGMATAVVIGHSLADLVPRNDRLVVVYSAEDDRPQYARKVAAQCSLLSPSQATLVKQRLLVPNLDDPSYMAARSLVAVLQGQPISTGTVEIIIDALRPMMEGATPLGLLIFETASTLSDAEETNPGFRVLILALRRIARELGVAVVLSHHVSQASLASLPDLNIATTDIRGGTALVNNARQTGLLVNLGSNDDPFPEADARTVLRLMVAPDITERVTALVILDSSKGINPPPVFFKWVDTDYGPAAIEVNAPPSVAGKPWRKVHSMLKAERAGLRAEAKQEAKASQKQEGISAVVSAVRRLYTTGQLASASKISAECGRSPGWSAPYLTEAVGVELLEMTQQQVPKTRGLTSVYWPAGYSSLDSSEGVK